MSPKYDKIENDGYTIFYISMLAQITEIKMQTSSYKRERERNHEKLVQSDDRDHGDLLLPLVCGLFWSEYISYLQPDQ